MTEMRDDLNKIHFPYVALFVRSTDHYGFCCYSCFVSLKLWSFIGCEKELKKTTDWQTVRNFDQNEKCLKFCIIYEKRRLDMKFSA